MMDAVFAGGIFVGLAVFLALCCRSKEKQPAEPDEEYEAKKRQLIRRDMSLDDFQPEV